MGEDVKPETIKKTQAALNKYIKKPPLTEKLLKKPPFRFLHDIITAIIRETGFLDGVFTAEELVADNVKDRDSKIKFLTKLITAVKDATGETIKAKPGKMVAGLEVDKTLELLQAIAKGVNQNGNGKKTTNSNQKNNNKKSAVKDTSKVNEKNKDAKNKTNGASPQVVNQKEPLIEKAASLEKQPSLEKEVSVEKQSSIEREVSLEGQTSIEKDVSLEKQPTGKDEVVETQPSLEKTSSLEKQPMTPDEGIGGSGEEKKVKRSARERSSGRRKSLKESTPITNGELHPENLAKNEEEKKSSAVDRGGGDEQAAPQKSEKRPQTRRTSSRASRPGPLKAIGEKGSKAELKESEEGEEKKKKQDKKEKEGRGPVTLGEGPGEARPPTAAGVRPGTGAGRRAPPSARPPSARPRSARPGAPKTRDRGQVETDINKDQAENEIKEVLVIAENETVEDKEDMVVVESPSLTPNEIGVSDEGTGVGGALIDSILETQIELDRRKSAKTQIEEEKETGRERKESWEKECRRLREGVQRLTRATGPLGKLFDFLQEDVELASRELRSWSRAATEHLRQLAQEQRLTEDTLSRQKKKLAELDQLIEEERDAIRSLKSSVLANDIKIQSHVARLPHQTPSPSR